MQDVKMSDTKIGDMKQMLLLALKLPGASSQRCHLV